MAAKISDLSNDPTRYFLQLTNCGYKPHVEKTSYECYTGLLSKHYSKTSSKNNNWASTIIGYLTWNKFSQYIEIYSLSNYFICFRPGLCLCWPNVLMSSDLNIISELIKHLRCFQVRIRLTTTSSSPLNVSRMFPLVNVLRWKEEQFKLLHDCWAIKHRPHLMFQVRRRREAGPTEKGSALHKTTSDSAFWKM